MTKLFFKKVIHPNPADVFKFVTSSEYFIWAWQRRWLTASLGIHNRQVNAEHGANHAKQSRKRQQSSSVLLLLHVTILLKTWLKILPQLASRAPIPGKPGRLKSWLFPFAVLPLHTATAGAGYFTRSVPSTVIAYLTLKQHQHVSSEILGVVPLMAVWVHAGDSAKLPEYKQYRPRRFEKPNALGIAYPCSLCHRRFRG